MRYPHRSISLRFCTLARRAAVAEKASLDWQDHVDPCDTLCRRVLGILKRGTLDRGTLSRGSLDLDHGGLHRCALDRGTVSRGSLYRETRGSQDRGRSILDSAALAPPDHICNKVLTRFWFA